MEVWYGMSLYNLAEILSKFIFQGKLTPVKISTFEAGA